MKPLMAGRNVALIKEVTNWCVHVSKDIPFYNHLSMATFMTLRNVVSGIHFIAAYCHDIQSCCAI